MKRIVLALAALSALTLAVLWAEGAFFRREVRREPESSVPVHPYADLQSGRESIAPPEAEDPPQVETTPIASDITADPPQLLTHFLSESDEITWATELVLVFDRPLHSVTVGIAAFDVDGRKAQGSLCRSESAGCICAGERPVPTKSAVRAS